MGTNGRGTRGKDEAIRVVRTHEQYIQIKAKMGTVKRGHDTKSSRSLIYMVTLTTYQEQSTAVV